jgi:hypothetical protein
MYLTQTTKSVLLTAIGCVVAVLLGFGITKVTNSTGHHMVTIGSTSVDTGFVILLAIGVIRLLFFVAYALFVIQGFRTHWIWGVCNLLLPVTALAFVFVHPRRAKIPAIVWGCGVAVLLILLGLLSIPVP